ncbi:hypothetical protein PO909_017053 [Leuciscus waleckii]
MVYRLETEGPAYGARGLGKPGVISVQSGLVSECDLSCCPWGWTCSSMWKAKTSPMPFLQPSFLQAAGQSGRLRAI